MSTSLPNIEAANFEAADIEARNFEATWKQEVNERLAAHRTRRIRTPEEHPTLPGMELGGPVKSSIAAKVAARYAKAPTYSEMLAAEARKAANAAAAAATAAGEAHAAAQAILTGLDIREESYREADRVRAEQRQSDQLPSVHRAHESSAEARRVAWQEEEPSSANPDESRRHRAQHEYREADGLRITLAQEAPVVDSEIEDDPTPPQPIPGNLIEFPRELFAARRARPRLAEGPLREEAGLAPGQSQMRIFEVEPDTISTTPLVGKAATKWSSIRLGKHPEHQLDDSAENPKAKRETPDSSLNSNANAASSAKNLGMPLKIATLEDRLMAAVLDFAIVTAAFLLFVLTFAICTPVLPTGRFTLISAVLSFFVIAFGYQVLFFALAESTPGMRYAKIALCTFDDENPTRRQMRLRVASLLLSLCPLGLGCAWIFFDEDHLSWHDRITRTYQRSYR